MNQHGTFDNIVRARPSCILSLDNEYLSHEMMLALNSNNIFVIFKRKI